MGSLYVASRLFLVRPWSTLIEQHIGSLRSVPVWTIIRDFPIHLWNATGFARICSPVGTPIMTDTPTTMKTRMSFATVCVEIDSTCTFPSELSYQIDDKKYKETGAGKTTEVVTKSMQRDLEAMTPIEGILTDGVQHDGVIEVAAEPSAENWTVYTKKKKKSSEKGTSQVQPCSLNPFSDLNTDAEIVNAELDESLTGTREEVIREQEGNKEVSDDKVTIESCDDSSEESEYETGNEGMEVTKMRILKEILRRRPMTKEQKVENLVNVSALLGVRGKEGDMKNIFSGIVERDKLKMKKHGDKDIYCNESSGDDDFVKPDKKKKTEDSSIDGAK
ncbi:uncharacterized protein LOC113326511 [Papaver somniferum]|uniref:uncharacterized protein LOC113326511 n=1 Tax=Papaver somniferum TaxID=3469 RepID=UPI000E6F8C21|nr:uncharacterized protein LOC113326511 [Papaver somniferum]